MGAGSLWPLHSLCVSSALPWRRLQVQCDLVAPLPVTPWKHLVLFSSSEEKVWYSFQGPGWRQGLRSLATKERRTTLAAPTSWGNVGRNSLDISQTKTPKKLKQNRINKIQTPLPQVFIFYDFSPLLCNLMSLYTKCRSHSTALRGKSGFECQPCVPWFSISLSVKWVNIT